MKKCLCWILLAALVFTLSACGGSRTEQTQATPSPDAAAPAQTPETETTTETPEAPTATPEPAAPVKTCGDGLTWEVAGGTLTIRGRGIMDDFELLDAPWDEEGSSLEIERVVAEPGVTYIGAYAFAACPNVTEVSLPEGLTGIGAYAFSDCMVLENIQLPSSLIRLDEYAFAGSGLKRAALPSGTALVGNMAFSLCTAREESNLPDTVCTIGENIFAGCDALAAIHVNSDSTADIWLRANGYRNRIQYDGAAEPAENHTWSGEIEGFTWRVERGALTVTGSGDMPAFAVSGGRSAPWSALGNLISSITVSEGVTGVGNYAFWGCNNAGSVSLPQSVTRIGSYAFSICERLTQIDLPAALTDLGDGAFSYCTSLERAVLPEGLLTIGSEAFHMCSSLREVSIPASVTSIGDNAFAAGPVFYVNAGSYAETWLRDNDLAGGIG